MAHAYPNATGADRRAHFETDAKAIRLRVFCHDSGDQWRRERLFLCALAPRPDHVAIDVYRVT